MVFVGVRVYVVCVLFKGRQVVGPSHLFYEEETLGSASYKIIVSIEICKEEGRNATV